MAVVAIATAQQSASGQELTPQPQPPADVPAIDAALSEPDETLEAPVAADVSTELAPAPEEAPALYGTQTFGDPQPLPMHAAPYDDGQPWVMDIRPSLKVPHAVVENPPLPPSDADARSCEGCGRAQASAADYARIYESIPFNRAEYNANPTYRHDSAMEILTGNARHQTIVRHSSTRPLAAVQRRPASPHYNYNPYTYGYLRPALRLNYYRYFPSLNPYINPWNLSGAF